MIEVKNLWFRYPNGTVALKDITLTINDGVTAVVGPNASGKTTLLKVLGLLYRPTKGDVKVDGVNYWELSKGLRESFRRRIVYVHEKPILIRGTVIDNVIYGLLIRGYERDEAIDKAIHVLRELGIEYLVSKRTKELSAGEAQAVALARAIVLKPKYLLLDEPTANLDLSKRRALMRLLKELSDEGLNIVVATHDQLLAAKLAKYVVVLEEGRLVSYGLVNEVLKGL
ncbi:MAG TPA: energy-coupling factor ABC transporter ATP-binding protein [Acidilobales archaeon]|nr:energy-coupling factor ABC transporter ATP-binding protein [Acidilobales archaeon]